MHHLPPQIRALMGRQIAIHGGYAGRPGPTQPAACLSYGNRPVMCALGCARWVGMDLCLCQGVGVEQAKLWVRARRECVIPACSKEVHCVSPWAHARQGCL